MTCICASWKSIVLAESDETVMLGRECYFPIESVNVSLLKKTSNIRYCHAKGDGEYYDIVIGEEVLPNGAWIYPNPFWEAVEVKGMVCYGEGVYIA